MDRVTSSQFASSAIWRFVDVISRKVVGLVVSILLARMIAPEAYGVVALTMVFIVFSDIFIINGFNIALIRKEETSPIDYSTVMTMSLVFTTVVYGLIWMFSPYIADFYESPDLIPVLRVITILLFFESVSSVIRAKATREMQFKKMTISAFTSSITSGVIALVFAYKGYGVWALVAQQVLANIMEVVMLLIVFEWHLSLKFSFSVAKGMAKFTIGVMGSSFLDFFANNICNLVIGKSYSTKDLGYFNRANMLPETIALNVYNSINSVLLPALSSRQNSDEEMKSALRMVMSMTLYLIFPLMFGLMGIADILIPVLLSDKWIPSIPLMYFCCLNYAVNPIRAIGYSAFYAKGQSKFSFEVEIVRCILMVAGIIAVVLIFKLSIYFVLAANMVASLIVVSTTQYIVSKLLGYSFKELFMDILPSLFMSIFMALIMYLIGRIQFNSILTIIMQILIGAMVYYSLSVMTKNANLTVLKGYILEKFSRK